MMWLARFFLLYSSYSHAALDSSVSHRSTSPPSARKSAANRPWSGYRNMLWRISVIILPTRIWPLMRFPIRWASPTHHSSVNISSSSSAAHHRNTETGWKEGKINIEQHVKSNCCSHLQMVVLIDRSPMLLHIFHKPPSKNSTNHRIKVLQITEWNFYKSPNGTSTNHRFL